MEQRWLNVSSAIDRIYNLRSNSRYLSIEGLRAWAVILIFNVHFFIPYYSKLLYLSAEGARGVALKIILLFCSHLGVDLFFVISGFLIYSTLKRNKPKLDTYIFHRLNRIVPAHFIVLLVIVFPEIQWKTFAANIACLPAFFPNIPNHNFVTWALGWEWLFYISMFILYTIAENRDTKLFFLGVLSFLAVLFIGAIYFNDANKAAGFVIPDPGRFSGFFIGVLVAVLRDRNTLRFNSFWPALIALCCVWRMQMLWSSHVAVIQDNGAIRHLYYFSVAVFFGIILFHLVSSRSILNYIFEFKPLRIIGQISYSFYLVHAMIGIPLSQTIVKNADSFNTMALQYMAAFIVTFIFSSFVYYYFERPYFVNKNQLVVRSQG